VKFVITEAEIFTGIQILFKRRTSIYPLIPEWEWECGGKDSHTPETLAQGGGRRSASHSDFFHMEWVTLKGIIKSARRNICGFISTETVAWQPYEVVYKENKSPDPVRFDPSCTSNNSEQTFQCYNLPNY
jgi:hypothetical protein